MSEERLDDELKVVRALSFAYPVVFLSVAAFMTNVTNNRVCQPESQGVLGSSPQGTFGVVGTSGVLQCLPMAPRMVGTTLSFKF